MTETTTYRGYIIYRFDGRYVASNPTGGQTGMAVEHRGFATIQAAHAWIDEIEALEAKGNEILATMAD